MLRSRELQPLLLFQALAITLLARQKAMEWSWLCIDEKILCACSLGAAARESRSSKPGW